MPVARRLCEGCERPLLADAHPNRRYHDKACARLARRRAGDALGRQATLLFPGPRSGANARSGLQVSLPKALAIVTDTLTNYGCARETREAAMRALVTALPERQRTRLQARTQSTTEVA
jgi:hypothetical protein